MALVYSSDCFVVLFFILYDLVGEVVLTCKEIGKMYKKIVCIVYLEL